jgi:hypothetical protein
VPRCGPGATSGVVQNDDSAGPNELAEEREINEYLVEPMAAVHERRIGGEALGDELWQRH